MDADSFLEWLKGFFKAERRIGRLTFALRSLAYMLFVLLAWASLFKALNLLPAPVLLLVFVPLISLAIRRLHDFNFSGWWALLAIIPYVNLALLGVLMLVPGSKGRNRFGVV